MAYDPSGSSVVSFQGTTPWVVTGSVQTTVNTGNSSVQVLNFPTNQNVGGSVVAFQGTNPFIITGSIQGTLNTGNSSVQVLNFPTNQSISGTVSTAQTGTQITSLVSITPSSVLVGASIYGALPPVTISGTPNVNVAGSVVAFQGTNPWIITGSVQTTVSVGNSSVQVLNFPSNQSVSGTVNVGNFPANQSVSGTVGTSVVGGLYKFNTGWAASIHSGFPAMAVRNEGNIDFSGTDGQYIPIAVDAKGHLLVSQFETAMVQTNNASVITVSQGSIGAVIVGGSIAASFTPPANQSVSGTVTANQGTNPWVVVGSVYGSGSVVSFQGGTQITSVSGLVNVSGSIAGTYTEQNVATSVTGLAMLFKSNNSSSVMSVPSPNTPFPITGNASVTGTMSVLGTVPVTQSTSPWVINGSVSGTVATTQSGTWISSIVNTVPSSVIVGASIFGLAPVNVTNTNLNVSGSVVAFQGAGWSGSVASQIKSGSVIAVLGGNTSVLAVQSTNPWVIQSIVGTYAEDAAHTSGDKGLFVLGVRNDTMASLVSADLDYGSNAIDSQGRTIIKPFASEDATIISYTGSIVSTSVTLIQASAIGKRSYITDFWLSNTGATTTLVYFKDGSTSIIGHGIAPTGGGESSPGLSIPFKTAPSQDLVFTPLSATSVLYLTVKGYQAQ